MPARIETRANLCCAHRRAAVPLLGESARAAGVGALCEFRHGNILTLVDAVEPSDVVIFAALGDTLGPLDETIRILRRFAKPDGVVLVSDSYIREGEGEFPGSRTTSTAANRSGVSHRAATI